MSDPRSTGPNSTSIATDIVIFGGGIAGLWLLNHLAGRGYSALLLEASALGNGQSIASQGIIHGGLKYALSGSLSEAANAIAGMPARWRNCLAGDDLVNLSGCKVLAEHYYMWSEGGYRSRLKAFLGSKSLRGKIESVGSDEYPDSMIEARGQGSLYKLPDFVIDTASLLETLASSQRERIFKAEPSHLQFAPAQDGATRRLLVHGDSGSTTIDAQRFIFAAGEGNADLMRLANLQQPAMQTRPLNMVLLRKKNLPRLFVHCIGDSFSLSPRLTVTSHLCSNGDITWYLGGELAESGVERSDAEQISQARRQVGELFPWVDLAGAEWACLRINRAEGKEQGRHRPDSVFLKAEQNFLVVWPTKFTLSPALADEVSALLSEQKVTPKYTFASEIPAARLAPVDVALPPWERCFA